MSPGGQCALGQCIWFSNYTFITGEPTLPGRYYLDYGYLDIYHLYLYPDYMRTFNDITINPGWDFDFTKTHPWRHPGTAPVYRWEVLLQRSTVCTVLYCTVLYCTALYCTVLCPAPAACTAATLTGVPWARASRVTTARAAAPRTDPAPRISPSR